jgi:RNA polymerase sigma factor (sigma-70 family)
MSGTELPDFPASQLFLRRLAFHLVRDEALAEDLVQDTFAAWVQHRPRGVAEPRAWLARVLRNLAFNAQRAAARRTRRERAVARPDAPDPGEPETEGTLETQAHLVAALRALAEPYRSTLVQRYYHDLSPRAIAERTGAPLETVKSRLARGLAKLRTELDRRHGGDRSAWCHWLAVVRRAGAPGVDPAPLVAGAGVHAVALPALAVVLVLVVVVLVVRDGPRSTPDADGERSSRGLGERLPVSFEEPQGASSRDAVGSADRAGRAPSSDGQTTEGVRTEAAAADVATTAARRAEPFEWPQLDGSAARDRRHAPEDRIASPRVDWFVPGLDGQPTLSSGRLYSGGKALVRLDPETGEVLGIGVPRKLRDLGDQDRERALRGDAALRAVPSPAVESLLPLRPVLARAAEDGSVSAFSHDLREIHWTWSPDKEEPTDLPGCLSGNTYTVPSGSVLVALDARNGRVRWRFEASEAGGDGRISTSPAVSDGTVFFATASGRVIALDHRRGDLQWSSETGEGDGLSVVASFDRIVIGGAPGAPRSTSGRVLAFDSRDGAELWRATVDGLFGVHPDGEAVLVGIGANVKHLDLRSGAVDERRSRSVGQPRTAPAIVGGSLVSGNLDSSLSVRDASTGDLRWTFLVPGGGEVVDFVHAGERIYVSTTIGLFCVADDPEGEPLGQFVALEWKGDLTRPYSPGRAR